ncbi:hypothetical protein D9757_008847 [Collybiopsis confluens]|uniref:Uncharacterized protein n=1 Tax=Collybiopsis confluens TaxID=2823264 RepID=A0A8H5H2X1_9AGAR|nr:hypothetical protein D9757_008847 [Collybiopsis confluens]
MSTLGDDGDSGWPRRHRRRPLSPGRRGVSANFYPSESRHPLSNARNSHRDHLESFPPSPTSRGSNVSLNLSENHYPQTSGRHRSQDSPGTNISGGIMSSVGGSQNIDSGNADYNNQNFKDASVQNNNYGININIHFHIHLGSGTDSLTLTRVVSFGLFGHGDAMIMRWF